MQGAFKYQGLTLWWALFIFVLCSIKMGGVSESPMFFAGFDKLVHCGLFFVLTVMLCSGMLRNNGKHNLSIKQAFVSFILAEAFGGFIEILQKYMFTWRSGDWADLFADTVGVGMGMFSVQVTLWAFNYEKK
ncbi:VanZ family protein [Mucilaginibacter sp. HMF5004]|uniref:VanZ family protein n=1 Tax=Mucilaginibacter rivuli TaxID=2857527 RepID=UPI001C60254F|nr:VanZ family protein [Mucilaginibacter rivuli]MBW4891097.1 VanZ family protein [Mucilaginibacter rivuli]